MAFFPRDLKGETETKIDPDEYNAKDALEKSDFKSELKIEPKIDGKKISSLKDDTIALLHNPLFTVNTMCFEMLDTF